MKVVICGAGIAGLALAQRLTAHTIGVLILDNAPGPRPQGYMIDFFGPGYDAAEAMGVLPASRNWATGSGSSATGTRRDGAGPGCASPGSRRSSTDA